MQRFHLVVDHDETAATLLTELHRLGAGRLTIMPLSQMARSLPPPPRYPDVDDAVPLLKKVRARVTHTCVCGHVNASERRERDGAVAPPERVHSRALPRTPTDVS
jgi:chromosome segregation ATPase